MNDDLIKGFDISNIDMSSLMKNIDYSSVTPKYTPPPMPEIIP